MLVAGEQTLANAITHLDLTAFQVPFPTAERLVKRHVNKKFFYQGITDTKVSAMQFFGGLLYALYNHEQIIRAYDSAGVLVNEWAVPVGKRNYVSLSPSCCDFERLLSILFVRSRTLSVLTSPLLAFSRVFGITGN
jgi:hypothetical protein